MSRLKLLKFSKVWQLFKSVLPLWYLVPQPRLSIMRLRTKLINLHILDYLASVTRINWLYLLHDTCWAATLSVFTLWFIQWKTVNQQQSRYRLQYSTNALQRYIILHNLLLLLHFSIRALYGQGKSNHRSGSSAEEPSSTCHWFPYQTSPPPVHSRDHLCLRKLIIAEKPKVLLF